MVTLAAVRPADPPSIPSPPAWPSVVVLLDSDGLPLSRADVLGSPVDDRVALGDVDEPHVLLAYFFSGGQRQVLVDLGDRMVDGWLGTRWEGNGRAWWVELDDC